MSITRRSALEVVGGAAASAVLSGPAIAKVRPVSNRSTINEYFRKLPNWNDFSPAVADGSQRTGDPATEIQDGQSCTRTEYTLSKNSDRIVIFDPDREILWPGALIQGRGYSEGLGSLRELPIKKRAPFNLGLTLLSKDNFETVKLPTATAVNAKISEIIDRVVQQKVDFGSRVSFASTASYTAEQAMLSLGVSAKYAGGSLSASHKSETSRTKSSATTYFIQNMFTVFMETPRTPADLFSGDFSVHDLNEQAALGRISPSNIPVYLSSISFGRILYVTTSADAEADQIRTAVAASYNSGAAGVAGNLSADQKKILQNSQMSITAIGGPTNGVVDLIKTGNLASYFAATATQQSVQPISFSFRNLVDLSLAAIRDATKYTITECTPVKASKEIIERTDKISFERGQMFRWVLGAVSNWADPGRRAQVMGWARGSMTSLDQQLHSLETANISASDKQWVKGVWMLRFFADLESNIIKAQREIPANSSDKGTQQVWIQSLQWSQSLKTIATGVQSKL
ncbi:thiol-activated cytolysin family protein [Bradyrhizobium diazoefficiens]|uniref:thiol-activated cytolysin family protein n=1 Tax=Bradyrhizobium diazoefficiens TaxID=1355477 RepID=UPI0036F23357